MWVDFADAMNEAMLRVQEQQKNLDNSVDSNSSDIADSMNNNKQLSNLVSSQDSVNYVRTDTEGWNYINNKWDRQEVYTDTGWNNYTIWPDGKPSYVYTDTGWNGYAVNWNKKQARVWYIPGVSKDIKWANKIVLWMNWTGMKNKR